MKLVIRKSAAHQIEEIMDWVENNNTVGAGERWYIRMLSDFEQRAKSGVKHSICRNEKLARRKYHCFTYNTKWVVAYHLNGDQFIISRFIWGAKLT
jgi:hypothetical protein